MSTARTTRTATPLPRRLGLLRAVGHQRRIAILAVMGLIAALEVTLLFSGLQLRRHYAHLGLSGCAQPHIVTCPAQSSAFSGYASHWAAFIVLLSFTPAVLGGLVGAPLLAREYETGTYRLIWTQQAGRVRWLWGTLALFGSGLVLLTAIVGLTFFWWYTPLAGTTRGRLSPGHGYDAEALTMPAWTMVMFAFGVLAGALIRRTVPAMAATLAGWVGLFSMHWFVVRPAYLAAVIQPTDQLRVADRLAWSTDQWWTDPAGHRLDLSTYDALLQAHPTDASGWLNQHGYKAWTAFQPDTRFWTFQLIDVAVLLSAVLLALTILVVRHRD
jgi:hypothetical protein